MKKSFLAFVFVCVIMGCEKEPDVTLSVVDFENAPTASLASSAYGDNLYGGVYQGYHDNNSDLSIALLGTDFYAGGITLSQWNDTASGEYTNQCSVFYKDAATGFGGHDGSKTFAVSYGCDNSTFLYGTDSRTFLGFDTEGIEKTFDHFYVTNSTYTAKAIMNGAYMTSSLSYENNDWFKLIITGINASGAETGVVEFYLADFRTSSSKGMVKEWTKVDLSSLGNVHKLRFDMNSSTKNDYGSVIPAYFCFDDVAIRDNN